MGLVYLADGLSNLTYTNRRQILVVEDQRHAQEVAKTLFDPSQCDVTTVFNISEALMACRQVAYDLIVIDWVLEENTAYELLINIDTHNDVRPTRNAKRRPFVIFTGKSPETISVPNIKNLQLVDFWLKKRQPSSFGKTCK